MRQLFVSSLQPEAQGFIALDVSADRDVEVPIRVTLYQINAGRNLQTFSYTQSSK
jgi:hypothetical protein